jgi:glycosyltransferase involved in cell wall biosynthesis
MKVALISYPMLFQKKGGLQIQVLETLDALKALNIDAHLFDILNDNIEDFDIIHVFGVANGNDNIVRVAKELGKKVVLSPLARCSWSATRGKIALLADKIIGRLTNWHVRSDHAMCDDAYRLSDHVVFLGKQEYQSAASAFSINESCYSIVPNGIHERYFQANGSIYKTKYCQDEELPIILVVASINARKNQLALVQALKDVPCRIDLVGPCVTSDNAYLEEILCYSHVNYIGYFSNTDPMLASAYAAADLFCLPSIEEVLPLTIFESLAAGTPVAATSNSAIEFECETKAYKEFDPRSLDNIRSVVMNCLQQKVSQEECQGLVESKTWQSVAEQLVKIYHSC